MAEHFLTKSRIDLTQCIKSGDTPVLERHAELHDHLISKAGPDVARLFAEPLISRGNDQAAPTVSWYSDRLGEGVPFAKLDDAGQAEVAAKLRERLAPLEALAGDGEGNDALVAAALYVTSPADIWSVGGHPVLINWGILPAGAETNATTRLEHYQGTLGRFLPLETAPPLSNAEKSQYSEDRQKKVATAAVAVAAGGVAAVAAAGAATGGAADTAPAGTGAVGGAAAGAAGGAAAGGGGLPPADVPHTPPEPRRRVPLLAWVPLLLLLLLVGGALAWLLIPGNRIFAQDYAQPHISDQEALEASREVNRELEKRLADLRAAHAGAVCRADGTLLMPNGVTIEGLLPPDPNDKSDVQGRVVTGTEQSILPPDPKRVVVDGTDKLTDTSSLLTHIDNRTAMVLASSQEGLSTGSGFFIGPDLFVTNFHVIEGATSENIFVTSKSMGGLKQVEVLKRLGPWVKTGADFALLRVIGANQPAYTLRQSPKSLRLQSVIAAGYPGDVLRTDREFDALRKGDQTAVPELTVTDGTVNTEQTRSETTHTVVHSAPISSGNSGGPLIDMCGRVVGVNTFVYVGEMRSLNFALASDDLLAFLQGTPAAPEISNTDCQPRIARPSAPMAEQLQ